jgi:ribosomal protein S18 acetylase RimI-like enzyme
MTRLKVTIRTAAADDRSMLYLMAEENLHPLAGQAGHPERFESGRFLTLLDQGEAYVAESPSSEIAGYLVVEEEDDALLVRCLCIGPAFEAQAVGHQLLDWAEGLAVSRGKGRLDAVLPASDEASRHLFLGHGFVVPQADATSETVVIEKRLPER